MHNMKKTIILIAYTALAWGPASATGLMTGKPTKLSIPTEAYHPVLSPDGRTILFSSQDHQGLNAFDIESGTVTLIDKGVSAGFHPVFSPDGKKVLYRTATTIDGLLNRDVRSFDLVTGRHDRLQAPNRDMINLKSIMPADYVNADYDHITLSINGRITELDPLPDAHSYLWASLSPDRDRIMFTEPFSGVYVCDLDGGNPRRIISKGDFPSWAGNDWAIAVVSHDDGYVILDSGLIAINISTGEQLRLTAEDVLVSEADASASGQVVYTTLGGEIYMLKLSTLQLP